MKHGKIPSEYIDSISEKYIDRWQRKLDQVEFTEEQLEFLRNDYLEVNIVVISGDWCPDCQNAVPIIMKMAEISDFINLYLLDRDQHKDLLVNSNYMTNGGLRVPLVIFSNEDFEQVNRWVEKSAKTYEFIIEAKRKAIEADTDDYGQYIREIYKERSSELFQANMDEIFQALRKSAILITASAKLERMKKEILVR